jgi:NCS1 family nucleobase:cation symporter-1
MAMTGAATAQVEPQSDHTFSIETHGIDVIPPTDRHGSARELFWVWFAANVIFNYVIIGAIIVGFGLNFWEATLAVLIGSAFYVLVGYGAIPGPVSGTATLAVSRSAFGLFGNIPAALLSWLTLVGWEAVEIVIGTLSLYQLMTTIGVAGSNTLKAICLVVVMVATFAIALLGHATIVSVNRIMSYVLGIGTLGLIVFIVPKFNVSAQPPPLAAPTVVGAILLALLVTGSSPFSWVNYPADYARYLPKNVSAKAVAWWTIAGGVIPTVIISMIGVGAATAVNMTDPVGGLKHLLPNWYLVPYLAIIVLGILTANFLNTYSSGMSLLAVGIRIKRYQAVLIDAVLATALAVYAVFISNFVNSLVNFLSFMFIWAAPWCGIYVVNIWLRRNHYDVPGLFSSKGTYEYSNGWNWPAVIVFAVSLAAGAMFANAPFWQGPGVRLIGGGDLSIFVGFVVAAVLYYFVMRGTIAKAPVPASAAFAEGSE